MSRKDEYVGIEFYMCTFEKSLIMKIAYIDDSAYARGETRYIYNNFRILSTDCPAISPPDIFYICGDENAADGDLSFYNFNTYKSMNTYISKMIDALEHYFGGKLVLCSNNYYKISRKLPVLYRDVRPIDEIPF